MILYRERKEMVTFFITFLPGQDLVSMFRLLAAILLGKLRRRVRVRTGKPEVF